MDDAKGNTMRLGRGMLALLLSALGMCAIAVTPAAAIGPGHGPGQGPGQVPGPCLCGDGAESEPDEGEAEDEDEDDVREAVPGRIPARISQRLVIARSALRDAAVAADAGRDRRAVAHLKQVIVDLGKAHDAAIRRADDELPGGAAAVRAVTAVQHRVIMRGSEIALDGDGRVYDRALLAVEAAAENRDEAADFLLETSGTERAVAAIGVELEQEIGALGEITDAEDTDEDLAEDFGAVLETVSDTAEALGLDLSADEDGEEEE
jgi:hypothetical protein